MCALAAQRNKRALAAGKVKFYCRVVCDVPEFERKTSKVLSVNSFEFWDDKEGSLRSLQKHMIPGGRMYIFHQVLHKKGESALPECLRSYTDLLVRAGYTDIRSETSVPLRMLCASGALPG